MAGPPAFATATHFAPLSQHHLRLEFKCRSDDDLGDWFRTKARQFDARGYARVWVWAPDDDPGLVLGYFTLTATDILREQLPGSPKELTRIPSVLIGKLARSEAAPKGSGAYLLNAALKKALEASNTLGLRYVVLDAINENVAVWYEGFGFQRARVPQGEHVRLVRLTMLMDEIRNVLS
jgi:GNAT superfamily N-acetyltransferase